MSTINNFGAMQAKKIEVANQIDFHGSADDTNTVTLNVANPASDYTIELPTSAGTLMTTTDDVELSQIEINSASEESSPANTNEIIVYNGTENKKMTLATLAGLSDFDSSVAGTDGQIVVYDSANAQAAVDMSGDATIANDGVITLADKPSAEKSAEANKFLHCDSSRDIDNINVLEAETCAGNTVEVGNSTNRWKFAINASGNLELSYSSDSGSSFAVKQVFQSS